MELRFAGVINAAPIFILRFFELLETAFAGALLDSVHITAKWSVIKMLGETEAQKYLKVVSKLLEIKESQYFKEPVNHKMVDHSKQAWSSRLPDCRETPYGFGHCQEKTGEARV